MSTSASSSATSRFCSSEIRDDIYPLWSFVTLVGDKPEKGGNRTWTCNFCQGLFKGSYSRVKAHLLRQPGQGIKACSHVRPEHLIDMNTIIREAQERAKPKSVPLPLAGASGSESSKRKKGTLEKAFSLEEREQLSSEIGRMFYSGGLPFHLARNPHYVNAFTMAANSNLSGYVPPSYNALRGPLLQRERTHIAQLLEPCKELWKTNGLSLVTDGWTDAQRRPLINFMAASEGNPIFLKAIDGTKEYKDKHYIAELMKSTVQEVGPTNVVQIITDNAPVCRAAGMLVEVDYPSIFWTPCVVHTLNLALKNICSPKHNDREAAVYAECVWITDIAEDASFIRNFIMNHSMRLAIFNEYVPLKLLAVADTRFASTLVMLKRLKLIKHGLQTMVISDQWTSYREDDVVKAQSVKDIILNGLWWDKLDYILSFTKPIYDMLRFCDTDKPTLHLVYDMWDSMIREVRSTILKHEGKLEHEDSDFYNIVHSVLYARWNKSTTPLHCLAHSLNPKFYTQKWLCMDLNRVAPHMDPEIAEKRNKCIRRYFQDSTDRSSAMTELARFSCCSDNFSSYDSLADRWSMDPKLWWGVYGSSTPLIQGLAMKLLSQPCSSSCAERNWSTYSFIHSLSRNKICPKRAEDLVYVHTNLRLLSRKSESYSKGKIAMWDIGGDQWDSFEGAGVLEVASLSLDEPDLEAVLFNEEKDNVDEV